MSRRIYYATEKPPMGAMLDRGHWAAQGLVSVILSNEGAGPPFDYISNTLGSMSGASWTPTPYGPALTFSGSSKIDIYNKFDFVGRPLSMVCRYNDTESSNYPRLISVCNAASSEAISFALEASTHSAYYSRGLYRRVPNDSNPANRWTHCAVTDANNGHTNVHIYIDGVEPSSYAHQYGGSAPTGVNQTITLGNRIGGDRTLTGMIEHAYVYNYALSADQIKSLHEAPYQAWYHSIPVFYSIPAGGPVIPIFAHHYAQLRAA